MAATFRNKKITEFGLLSIDGQTIPIEVGNYFQTADATGTPQTSPLAYSGTTVYNLVVPTGAIQVTFLPTTDLRFSELSDVSKYDLIKANTKEIIDCASMANIYVKEDSADGSLYFKFIFV